MTITEQVNTVVEARANAKHATEVRTNLYEEWLATYHAVIETEKAMKETCQEAEVKLRELALQIFAETRDKAVAPGVSVKIFEVLDYEPKEAFKWAMAHQIALSLDKKSFETFAKATPLEFVTIKEEPRAQIAQDLTNCTKGDTL